MTEEGKSAEEELQDAVWQWATRIAIAGVLVGAGYFGGYMQFREAVKLSEEHPQLADRITDLENQRETSETRVAKESHEKDLCRKELKALKSAQ
jgi:hypothetical protein